MDRGIFSPARRVGVVFLVGVIILLIGGAFLGLYQATQASIGPAFLAAILPVLIAVLLVPILAYRLFGLSNASYILQRDGIKLQWGFRIEDIPMTSVLWVRRAGELDSRLPLPWIILPGSVTGIRKIAGTGAIEYLSPTIFDLLVIATPGQFYAIAPAERGEFLETFNRFSELGSLTPITSRSIQPSLLMGRVWSSWTARILIILGAVLSIALFVWISLSVPKNPLVALGFQANLLPREPISSVQLLLLPLLNGLFYFVNLLLGLVFFRLNDKHPLAYILWGNGVVVPLLFLLGAFYILVGI